MKLKKWKFVKDFYDSDYYVVFAENIEEALEIINKGENGDDIEYYDTLDDYADIEELSIKNPSKAYKGYYLKEWCY